MKIITIIPLKKGLGKDYLSYFSSLPVDLGDLVEAPVKDKNILGIVVKIKEPNQIKAEIKNNTWQMRKLNRLVKSQYFSGALIKAGEKTADYFATYVGQILKTATPLACLELAEDRSSLSRPKVKINKNRHSEIIGLQEPEKERLAYYRSLIRETFAKKQSIFICVPNANDVEKLATELKKGIENYVLLGHGQLNKKDQQKLWREALAIEHPILLISTPLFLSIPRQDIDTLIIEKENSPSYKTISRPFFDWRFFAEQLAKENNWRLVLSDNALRSETVYRLGKEELVASGSLKYRFLTNNQSQLIAEANPDKKETELKAISDRLAERIENALDKKEKIFIYSGRRGLAPLTICRDCGIVTTCEICQSPLAIHQGPKKERFFVCHKCGEIVEIEDDCRRCGGQRLAVLGFGVEKIISELENLFPQTPVFRLDSDEIKTSKRAKIVAEQFAKVGSAILVGTELALPYLEKTIDNVFVLGVDTFLALPDWRASEKLFVTLLRLKQSALKNFIIQTRQPEEKIFDYVITGNLIDYYRDEIAERKNLGYPPFTVLLKISLAGKGPKNKKDISDLADKLTPWEPLVYPDLNKNPQGLSVLNILLRRPANSWPDPELLIILKSLTPNFIINVDPATVL